MFKALTPNEPEALNLMQAAVLAGCHLTNLYKLRNKLGAFKRGGVWLIPRDNLNRYIANRVKKTNDVLATAAVIEDQKVEG